MLAAVLYVGGSRAPDTDLPLIASVERVQGVVATSSGSRLPLGSGVVAGTEIVTGESQLALRLASGGSLRIAEQSRVVLAAGDQAELVTGMLYFDSEGQRRGAEFAVTTELGLIRDVGTQFFVQLLENDRRLDVGVRDGRVILARDGASDPAVAGERLVATEANALRREPLASFGQEWEWAERLAPPFDIDGRTVSDFLEWFAAQTGRAVVFADATAERLARDNVLNGSIDLEPLQKLAAVDALTDLVFTVEGERVVVRAR
jgi:ferric-dicitrate binding protein FerR (iron transport regulator)